MSRSTGLPSEWSAFIQSIIGFAIKIDRISLQPQNSIPDVIIWLLTNGKRYAYYRIPAHELFYSTDIDRRGRLCGKVQTITMKWPGRLDDIQKDKRCFIPAEIRIKLWFGLAVHERDWFSQQKGAQLAIYAETYENQTNVLGQWTTSGPLMTRPSWSDVTGTVKSTCRLTRFRNQIDETILSLRWVCPKKIFTFHLIGGGTVIGTSVQNWGSTIDRWNQFVRWKSFSQPNF